MPKKPPAVLTLVLHSLSLEIGWIQRDAVYPALVPVIEDASSAPPVPLVTCSSSASLCS